MKSSLVQFHSESVITVGQWIRHT